MAAHRRQFRRRLLFPHRRPRLFKNRSNPLETLEEDEVFERFRFHPQTFMNLVGLLSNLAHPTKRTNPLPPFDPGTPLFTVSSHLCHPSSYWRFFEHFKECCWPLHTWNRATYCCLAQRLIVFPNITAAETKRGFSSIAGKRQ